jgi:hypothetical protein
MSEQKLPKHVVVGSVSGLVILALGIAKLVAQFFGYTLPF